MKKLLLAPALALALAGPASAQSPIKVGVMVGFTGPIESLAPDIALSAEVAMKEVTESGKLLGGRAMVPVRADSTCIDSAVAVVNAEKLVIVDEVAAIVGADCSGVTGAVVNNVSSVHGVVAISPSATSPGLSTIADRGYFFRTAPSDARQGEVLADILMDRGVREIAVTYTNNDYGKGLADSFGKAFAKAGGRIAMSAAHEDGKADYSAEVGALAATGADHLAVFGYIDQGGKGIVQASLDSGAFETFVFADGMIGDSLVEALGRDIAGSFGTTPGAESEGAAKFVMIAKEAGMPGAKPYTGSAYDAAAILALAMQAAGSADRTAIRDNVMRVANAPGEKIGPGELARALEIVAAGGDVDYVGATNVEFNEVGEVFGTYRELEVRNAMFDTIRIR